ncbi:MAG TPA: TolC family protein [Tahibacter sp.]|uniref:TolC family protein n=1 Tax=Tahibacter sp. TaxID=2056211 RepID=UPI002B72040B|nr:TolC family protein [Tahibacter sp.]HSX62597.1 TolC family protein [Tahibacter sp.]
MRFLTAAIAALSLVPGLPVRASGPSPAGSVLTLDAAFDRTIAAHPDLRVFEPRRAALVAERERAAQRPAWTAGAELENAFGSGDARGLHSAELTLTLAGVLERGGKQAAREALAQRRIDALGVEREARRLDLLAETARRYLAIVAARQNGEIARQDIEQRTRAVTAARRRLDAGASPESVLLTAESALARAELDRDRAAQRFDAARQHLAALWDETDARFEPADHATPALPAIAGAAALARLLEQTPELAQFADERRVREARLQLARSEAKPNIDVSFGLRRRESDDDFGLVGAISVPLGARGRARPGIRAAEAELTALDIEREARIASLRSTLAEAHGRYGVARLEATRYVEDILPKLAKAEAAAERSYRAGAISYLEWAQVQSEHTAARRQRLDAEQEAQRALIELQRLTAEPFVPGTSPNPEAQP